MMKLSILLCSATLALSFAAAQMQPDNVAPSIKESHTTDSPEGFSEPCSSPGPAACAAIDETPTAQAIRVLQEAISAASYFPQEEQADLLLDAATAALPLDKDLAARWSIQLLNMTQKLTAGNYRSAMQKNALTTLAQVDAPKAAEMYTLQDDPPTPRLSEDIRAYGTRTLFPALWSRQGFASLERITAIANWLGSSGQYPYAGIGSILAQVNEKDPDPANELFAQAVSYFDKGLQFSTNNSHFVDFLVKNYSIAQPSVLRGAIQKALDAIESSDAKKPDGEQAQSFVYQLNTGKRSFEIHSQTTYLVYRLASIAAVVDPRWPEQIKAHFTSLANLPSLNAADPVTVSSAVSMGANPSGDVPAALGMSLSRQLQNMAQTDPQAALEQTNTIGDPTERAIAQASILPYDSKMAASDQTSWLAKLQKMADAMPAGLPKLRLLIHLAQDQLALHHAQDGLQTASHAFDLGEELFSLAQEAHPEKMAYTLPGFDPLLELASHLAASDPPIRDTALSRISTVRNDLLQAHSLVAYAQGLGQSKDAQR